MGDHAVVKSAVKPGEKKQETERLPFRKGNCLWAPPITSKSPFSQKLIGGELALSYLKSLGEEGSPRGLENLYFIARDMFTEGHKKDRETIVGFFEVIDTVLRNYCVNRIPFEEFKLWYRMQKVSLLARGYDSFPKTWKTDMFETIGKLDDLV